MAKARKLPSGSWRVQCYAGKNAEGKNQYRSFTRPTKEAEYEAALFAMHYKEISRDSTAMTLAEAMDKYIASKDGILSPSTIRGYDIIRKNHLKGLMDIRLNRLTPALIQEAINQEAKPYIDKNGKTRTPSPKSVRNIHGPGRCRSAAALLPRPAAEHYPPSEAGGGAVYPGAGGDRRAAPRGRGDGDGDPGAAGGVAVYALIGDHRPDVGLRGLPTGHGDNPAGQGPEQQKRMGGKGHEDYWLHPDRQCSGLHPRQTGRCQEGCRDRVCGQHKG